jgi:hypothetical protein
MMTVAGWAAIAGSLASSIWIEGWSFGPVAWVAQLSVTGLLLVLMLPYVPRVVLAIAVLGVGSALVLLFN